MRRRIHGKVGDANTILCYCPQCGKLQHVEEHGRDRCPKCRVTCKGQNAGPYLEGIPRDCRDMHGMYMVRKPLLEESDDEALVHTDEMGWIRTEDLPCGVSSMDLLEEPGFAMSGPASSHTVLSNVAMVVSDDAIRFPRQDSLNDQIRDVVSALRKQGGEGDAAAEWMEGGLQKQVSRSIAIRGQDMATEMLCYDVAEWLQRALEREGA
jgi:hypothetical protein